MSVNSIGGSGVFSVGDVLNRTWHVFIGNARFFLGITALVYVAIFMPLGALAVLALLAGASDMTPWLIIAGVPVAIVLFLVLNAFGEAVLLFGTFQRLRGEPLRVGEAMRRAVARFFPLVGLAILWFLGLAVGFLLLIIPMFFLLVIWAVAAPACIVEGLGPIASMSRSAALTKGYRWRVLGLILILSLINSIGGQFFSTALGVAGEWAAAIGSLIWFVAWNALWNCALIMMYHDLRVAQEGVDTQQVAAIFD